ncbi:MAG: EGF domain-containing protein [Minicystis sp.]
MPAALVVVACGGGSAGTGGAPGTGGSTIASGGAGGAAPTTTASSTSSSSGTGGAGGSACGCGPNASCDAQGNCVCDPGFLGDGQKCDDIDECADHLDDCHPTAACTNTPGSFTCTCPLGKVGDPHAGCDSRYAEIAAGAYHTCARRQDNAVFCFGNGGSGRLGNGITAHQPAPVQAGAASNWKRISGGTSHTCGIKQTGTLWCWGLGNNGQLGLGYTDSQTLPASISLTRTWTSVAAGETHTCAVESDGTLSCFGRNNAGQLATGSANAQELLPVYVNVDPAATAPESDWKEVFSGRETSCATKQNGNLYCWGRNGDLQAGKTGGGTLAVPNLIETSVGAKDTDWATASIGFTTCALKNDGSLFCWGRGAEGELGNGGTTGSAPPVAVMPGTPWKTIGVGTYHACGIQMSGALYCWGRNQSAQIAAGSAGAILQPVQVGTDTDWIAVTGGAAHTCALKQDGRAMCWGSRVYGEIGDGTLSLTISPAKIGATWTGFATFGDMGCALGPNGEPSCWGNGEHGELATGDTASRPAPFATMTTTAFSQLAPGRQHVCGITKTTKQIQCAGRNANGQLATGNTTASMTFAPILTTNKPYAGLSWSDIASGELHGCAIATDASLWCWGYNAYGQVGQSANPPTGTLVQVAAATTKNWAHVIAGQYHTCATRTDHSLHCFGRNVEGQIGDGTNVDVKTPFSHGAGWSDSIAAGVNHTCAIKLDGTLWCWGKNANSQLGDNTTTDRLTPTQIGTDTDWAQVSAGNLITCARKTSGSLWCWGTNGTGQLGVGDLGSRKTPTQIPGSTTWVDVRAGYTQACGMQSDGSLWCWGSGELGQNATNDGWAAVPTLIKMAP